MTKTRNIADLLDANGDVKLSALDNVPASNDASALTTGTLPDGRFPATLPAVSGANLTNIITDVVDDTTPQLGGNLDTNGNDITFGDNDKAIFGAGSDLQIYHDASDSYVTETGTGSLYIGADSTIGFTNAAVTEVKAQFITNGACKLFYDDVLKFETTATGVTVTGTLAATSFTGDGSALTGVGAAAVGFQAYGSLGWNSATGNINVRLNQEYYDTDNGFNTSTYTYTVPTGKGGLWYLYGQCYFGDGSSITSQLYIKVNGSIRALTNRSGSSGSPHSQQTFIGINLAAADTVNLVAYRSSGFNDQSIYEADGYTFLGGFRVG
jgi:hypothetical protein